MTLTIERVVSTLDDLDFLDLEAEGPWQGEPDPDAESTFEVAWKDVEDGRDESLSEAPFSDDWDLVVKDLGRVSTTGPRVPPPDVLDALAWYLPIHYYGPDSAIYIRETAVLDMARTIYRRLPGSPPLDRRMAKGLVRAGLATLYLHEAFHHKVESFAIRLEVIEHARRYVPYHNAVFGPLRASGSDGLLEEALACAEMKRRLGEGVYRRSIDSELLGETKLMLDEWIPTLPPGYRRGADFFNDASYQRQRNLLSSQIHEAREQPMRRRDEWFLEPKSFEGFFNCRTIAHVLVPVDEAPIIPWFNQPAVGLSVSSREAVRILQTADYTVVSGGKGSHVKLKKPGEPQIILPGNRKALSVGALQQVKRALGLGSINAISELL